MVFTVGTSIASVATAWIGELCLNSCLFLFNYYYYYYYYYYFCLPFKIHLALWSWKWYRVFVSGSLNFSNKTDKVPLICILQTIIAWLAFLYFDLVIIEKLVYYSTDYWKSQSLDSVNLSKFEQNQMLMKLHILQCIQVPLWTKSKIIVEVQHLIGYSWGGMMT